MPFLRRRALATVLFGITGFVAWSCSERAPSDPAHSNDAFGGGAASHVGGTTGEVAPSSNAGNGGDLGSSATLGTGHGGDAPEGGASAAGNGSLGEGGAETPSLGPDGYPSECHQQPPSDPAAIQETQLRISLQLAGEPFVFGEPNVLPQGGTLIPTNFRFYLSQFAFHQGEQRIAATPVDDQGEPLPYGVALVNSESSPSLELRLRTTPGVYDGVSLLLGLSHACNQSFFPLDPPLDEASQLSWPHTLGFLFLRFEAILDDAASAVVPSRIHMGAAAGPDGQAPRFHFALADAAAGELRLEMAVARVLEGAASEVDLTDFKLPEPAPPIHEEMLAGERLRRTALSLEIFTLSSSP